MITSWRHDEQKKKKRRQNFAVLLFLALLLLLMRGPVANLLGGVLAKFGRPVWWVRDKVELTYASVATVLSSKAALEADNQKMKALLDQIALDAYSRDQLRTENDQLKAMLGRKSDYTYTITRVLSAPPVSPYDTLLIDAGTDQGVFVGMEAFSQGDFKVGEVTRVWGASAIVSLYSTPNTQLSVTVGTSSIPAVAWGQGGGNLRIILPRGVSVKEGDLVSIPSIAPEYAGTVDAIVKPEGSSLEALYVRLPFDVEKEGWLYLGTPKENTTAAKTAKNP